MKVSEIYKEYLELSNKYFDTVHSELSKLSDKYGDSKQNIVKFSDIKNNLSPEENLEGYQLSQILNLVDYHKTKGDISSLNNDIDRLLKTGKMSNIDIHFNTKHRIAKLKISEEILKDIKKVFS